MAPRSWHPLTLRTVTPALLGWFATPDEKGARIPFPVPSLRGALGFWLRALAGAHVGNELRRLLQVESEVFGAARTATAGGSSVIALRAGRVGVTAFSAGDVGVGYLLGPREGQERAARRCLGADREINLEVKNYGTPAHADLFLAALWGLRTFGGIGARARRGFGTITLSRAVPVNLECQAFDPAWLGRNDADDLTGVLECVRVALPGLGIPLPAQLDHTTQPSYPRFDLPGGWYLLSDTDLTGLAGSTGQRVANDTSALGWTGDRLRSFRHDGDPSRTTAGYRQVAKPYLDGNPPKAAFRAGALGLPVVYTEKPPGTGMASRSATVAPIIDGQPARRASPLWLRVYKRDLRWWLRSLAFDAVWLPTDAELKIKDNDKNSKREPKDVPWPSRSQVRAELERWFAALDSVPQPSATNDPAT